MTIKMVNLIFITLAVLRRSAQQVCEDNLRVIAPGQHSFAFKKISHG